MLESNVMENWLTIDEVAALAGVSNEAVRRKCLRGSLAYVRKGGRRFIRQDHAELYVRDRVARRRALRS